MAVTLSFTDPVALGNGTWGYAIPHSATSVKSTNGFDDSYSTMSSATPNGKKFAAVPTSSQQAQLIAETGTSNSGTPNQFNVYYGVKADYSVVAGTYTNKVLYTGIADAGPTHNMVVFPEETPSIDGGDTLTINTSLFTTASTVSANAYILDQSELTAVTASPASISNYSSSQMDCTSSTANGYLELTCTNIAKPIGNYFVYVDVPDYGQHYSKAFNYVANFYNITYMQDMTADICNDAKYVTTPGVNVFNGTKLDNTTGNYPRATYADTGRTVTYQGNTVNTYRPNHLGDTDYVPETTMKDKRKSIFYKDNQGNYSSSGTLVEEEVEYTVRKLADGNCWMTENLALNYEEGREFTSADTNVTSTKTAAHATQSLNGVVTGDEIDQNCSTNVDERICWYEGSTKGAYADRWLSRSTNGATEQSLDFPVEVQTGDNQKIGTYYNWYTATVSSVPTTAGIVESSEDICPTNWEMPRDDTISGSWSYLIRDTYQLIIKDGEQERGGVATEDINSILHRFPFTLLYSGYASRASGNTDGLGSTGPIRTGKVKAAKEAMNFGFRSNIVNTDGGSNAFTTGLPIRCIVKQAQS